MRAHRLQLLVALAGAAGVLLMAPAALAEGPNDPPGAYPPPPPVSLGLSSDTIYAGDTVTLTGRGFGRRELVRVTVTCDWGSFPYQRKLALTSGSGAFSTSLDMTEACTTTVAARGLLTGRSGAITVDVLWRPGLPSPTETTPTEPGQPPASPTETTPGEPGQPAPILPSPSPILPSPTPGQPGVSPTPGPTGSTTAAPTTTFPPMVSGASSVAPEETPAEETTAPTTPTTPARTAAVLPITGAGGSGLLTAVGGGVAALTLGALLVSLGVFRRRRGLSGR